MYVQEQEKSFRDYPSVPALSHGQKELVALKTYSKQAGSANEFARSWEEGLGKALDTAQWSPVDIVEVPIQQLCQAWVQSK